MFEADCPIDFIAKHGNWSSAQVMNTYIRNSAAFREKCAGYASGGLDNVVRNSEPATKRLKKEEEIEDGVDPGLLRSIFSNCKMGRSRSTFTSGRTKKGRRKRKRARTRVAAGRAERRGWSTSPGGSRRVGEDFYGSTRGRPQTNSKIPKIYFPFFVTLSKTREFIFHCSL
mmetsp:Transcript_40586/g.56409  ORF Transcript_40586/g.56409 Transcript_40586/m.56409 type:complete len:171 (+) Transcript_40586:281-793(+)